jgi:tRNA modification GTPase
MTVPESSTGVAGKDRSRPQPGEQSGGSTPRTIFAVSTGVGIAAIAVVRISGPAAGLVLEQLAGRRPRPRQATLAALRHPSSGAALDRALVFWYPAPRSFTGEDSVELHLHGGRAVVAAVLGALEGLPGLRPAEPGEFTRRAFLNGKLDLTAVEGLADLLHAETEAQRRQALSALEGGLRDRLERWRQALLRVAALIEAELDFADEDDVPSDIGRAALVAVPSILAEMQEALADSARGERVRDGLVVVLAGPPNAGKSSLLNALARRDVAIVSPEAGTTRDLIEVHLDLAGNPMTVVDTAGLRESESAVEREGVRRALDRARSADLVLWLSPADDPAGAPDRFAPTPVWTLISKADLVDNLDAGSLRTPGLPVSAVTGNGLSSLLDRLQTEAGYRLGGGPALVTRARQRLLLSACVEALRRAMPAPDDLPLELVAEEIRTALARIGQLTGRVDVEQLLDVIFSEFCIGK